MGRVEGASDMPDIDLFELFGIDRWPEDKLEAAKRKIAPHAYILWNDIPLLKAIKAIGGTA